MDSPDGGVTRGLSPETDTVETNVTQLLSDKHGQLRYVAEAGILSFLEQVRRHVAITEASRDKTGPGQINSESVPLANDPNPGNRTLILRGARPTKYQKSSQQAASRGK